MNFLKPICFATFIGVSLTGCLDLASDDDDDSTSLSGKAADGYLASANVCLDLNGNKVCDRGEPSATTGPNGDFTINASPSDVNSATILVEIIAGVTEDQDNPGVKVDKAYSLSAPAGYKFVSPITTLVQAEVEKTGGSVSTAVNALKARLGTEVDFDEDYVAGQSDPEKGAEFQAAYEKLHKVAQVVATVIRNNLDNVSVDQDSANFKEVLKLVVAKVDVALESINSAVENDSAAEFDPQTLLTNNEDITNSTEVNTDSLADELALQEDIDAATTANLGTLLSAGVYWLEYDYNESNQPEIGYGVTMFDGETTSNTFYTWNGSSFASQSAEAFIANSSKPTSREMVECLDNCYENTELLLTDAGWVVANFDDDNQGGDGPSFDGVNSDGSVLMTQGPIQVRLAGEEFDLSGNKIKGTLNGTGDWEWASLITTGTTFTAGAKGYKLNTSVAEDVFIMPNFNDSCTSGDNQEDQSSIAGNCNLVRFINAPGGDVGSSDPTAIQPDTFNPIVTTRGTGNNPLNYKGLIMGFEQDSNTGYIVEFGPNDKIFYYKVVVANDAIQSFDKVLESPYVKKTVNGKTLIVFDVPFKLGISIFDDQSDDNSDMAEPNSDGDNDKGPQPTALFLTAHEGYWRFGASIEAGTVIPDDAPFVYNQAAMDDIIDTGFSADLIPSEQGVEEIIVP